MNDGPWWFKIKLGKKFINVKVWNVDAKNIVNYFTICKVNLTINYQNILEFNYYFYKLKYILLI